MMSLLFNMMSRFFIAFLPRSKHLLILWLQSASAVILETKKIMGWPKFYDQPRQHIKKQRHYFANKVRLVKAMVFPVVMYGCESWTVKKAERRRIDAFELWC